MSNTKGATASARPPLLYLSFGVTKSGSTLAYRMTQYFLECRGYAQPMLPDHLLMGSQKVNFWGKDNLGLLQDICDWVEAQGLFLVIKTHHSPTERIIEWLTEGRAFAHATYRDPREIALSMMDHGARSRARGAGVLTDLTSAKDSVTAISSQLNSLKRWEHLPNVETWYYDDFAFNADAGFDRLAWQTGLALLTPAEKAAFDGTRDTKFNKAVRERWKTDLSAEEKAHFRDEFDGFYKRLWRRRLSWRSGPVKALAKRVVG